MNKFFPLPMNSVLSQPRFHLLAQLQNHQNVKKLALNSKNNALSSTFVNITVHMVINAIIFNVVFMIINVIIPAEIITIISVIIQNAVVNRPLSMDGGMAENHGAPEAGQLSRAWTRVPRRKSACRKIKMRQYTSSPKKENER